ncbi:hypothetical protein GUJ93_ZPchr0004g38973 [Zizania palustris]|uniref:Uncharacterized protein n=1 Tax=Zizania palustris TaxID=103762 RepID=A0A8J5SM29_ZIZPA|nr:hypothetical protein GUJ93_ZPchr0004g38973 [Zizania palustris]
MTSASEDLGPRACQLAKPKDELQLPPMKSTPRKAKTCPSGVKPPEPSRVPFGALRSLTSRIPSGSPS